MCALKKRLKHNFIFYQYFLSNEILIILSKKPSFYNKPKNLFFNKSDHFLYLLFLLHNIFLLIRIYFCSIPFQIISLEFLLNI